MNRILIYFILINFLSFSGCDSTNPNALKVHSVENYFPLKIGNKWEYLYTNVNNINRMEKTLKSKTIHEDGSNIWGYTVTLKGTNPDPNEPISGYYTINFDGLYFYSSQRDTMFYQPNITLCNKILLLNSQIKVGTQWETMDGAHRRIESINDYQVFESNYPNTVLVISERDHSVDSSWYSLNVGLIKSVYHFGLGQQTQSSYKRELINYSLQ